MKKLVIVFCILLCASAAFAKTASMQIGFSTLGVNAGAAAHFGDRFKVGVNGSIVLLGDKNSNDNSFLGWLFGQGFFSVDLIENTANDLDMRFAFAYMQPSQITFRSLSSQIALTAIGIVIVRNFP